jgi:hypothetical protein
MPEPKPGNHQLIALVLYLSAVALGIAAVLIFTGTIPVQDAARPMIAAAVGLAAFADLAIGTWFFRKGQSS